MAEANTVFRSWCALRDDVNTWSGEKKLVGKQLVTTARMLVQYEAKWAVEVAHRKTTEGKLEETEKKLKEVEEKLKEAEEKLEENDRRTKESARARRARRTKKAKKAKREQDH